MAALTLIRKQPRRFTLFAAAMLIAFFAFLIGTRSTGHATSGSDPYSVPSVVDTNPDPNIVETTLIAEEATVDIGNGVMAHAQTFNGQIPGPTFHLNVGDTVIVHFENHLSEPTGIHWHGIELNNASDGTPLTQNQVPAGGTFLYKFKVTRPGIFWYHPHHHASTDQVFKGLYGAIIVTDPYEVALQGSGVLPSPAQTLTLELSDMTVCKAVGSNDAATYDPSLPFITGGALPAQPAPTPVGLCETAPIDEAGVARGAFAAGDIPNIQGNSGAGRTNEGQTVLTNGVNVGGRAGTPSAPGALAAGAQSYDVQAGQGLRLHIGNTATIRFFRLRLTDGSGTQIPLVRVGGEGGLLDHAVVEGGTPGGFDTGYGSGEILLDPGSRADVVAAIPPGAATDSYLTLWTEDYSRTGAGFSDIPTVPVAHFHVTGPAGSTYTIGDGTPLRESFGGGAQVVLGPATGHLLDPAAFAPPKPGMSSEEIKLTNPGSVLGIDGVKGSHDAGADYKTAPEMASARYAKLGDILELKVTNTTGSHHPFHLHGFSMQPIDLTKSGSPTYTWPYHEYRDNIDVPPGYTLRFRIRLDDRPLMDGTTPGGGLGRWLFHCHIFFHATNGMISELDVVDPTGNARPNVNVNGTSVEVNEGSTATMNGVYNDPDAGDTVTLSASKGTVTDNHNGTFSWSFTTTNGPAESGFVYITATDAGGHTDQAAFYLKVDALPPVLTLTSPAPGTYPLASPIHVASTFTDPGTGETHNCSIDWGDGNTTAGTVVEAAGSGSCTGDHTYSVGGDHTITVTVDDGQGESDSAQVTIHMNTPPTLVLPGPQSQDYHDPLSFGISATDPDVGDTVSLGASGLPAGLTFVDNGDRTGTVSGTLTAVPGVYTVTFSADDHVNPTVNKTLTITVTQEETTLSYTGPTVIANGFNVTLSAVLNEDGTTPISGRTVDFTLGSQTCSGTTDGSGSASCTILVSSALGSATVNANFAGDAYYLPSSDTATAIVFAFLAHGAFTLGDVTVALPALSYTWWSSQWSLLNTLSGGTAPSSFKGFAGSFGSSTATPPSCGGTWTTRTGNSTPPASATSIPSYMGVVVPSSVTKSGAVISGNVPGIVVVKTDPGYAPAPGHPGTGTIVATYC